MDEVRLGGNSHGFSSPPHISSRARDDCRSSGVWKESVTADTIPAIKADKRLNLNARETLIALVEKLRVDGEKTQTISHVIMC